MDKIAKSTFLNTINIIFFFPNLKLKNIITAGRTSIKYFKNFWSVPATRKYIVTFKYDLDE